MFDQRLSDYILTTSIDNRSSAILFFVVADNSTAFPMKVRCILCDTPMTINNGSNGLNTSNLVNHLNEQHFQLHAKMKRRYQSMENLLNGVKFPTIKIERVVPTRQTTLDNTFHVTQVRAIEDGSRKRGGKRREAEEKEKEKEKEKEERRREEKQMLLLFQLKGQTVMQLKDCNFVHQKNEFALRMSIARSMLTRKFLPLLFQDCH